MPNDVTGLVLAGGQSRRMGRDKAHLPWGRTTLIAHTIETLRPLVNELLVVVDDARRFRHLDARVVEDLVPNAHALGGLYTGLRTASYGRCFASGCDTPFLNPQLIRFLLGQAEGYDLVIPRTAQGLQPLHAVYARSALAVIEEQLRDRQWGFHALVPKVRTKIVEPKVIAEYDPEHLSFFNLNTPEDYVRAAKAAFGEGSIPVAAEKSENMIYIMQGVS